MGFSIRKPSRHLFNKCWVKKFTNFVRHITLFSVKFLLPDTFDNIV